MVGNKNGPSYWVYKCRSVLFRCCWIKKIFQCKVENKKNRKILSSAAPGPCQNFRFLKLEAAYFYYPPGIGLYGGTSLRRCRYGGVRYSGGRHGGVCTKGYPLRRYAVPYPLFVQTSQFTMTVRRGFIQLHFKITFKLLQRFVIIPGRVCELD